MFFFLNTVQYIFFVHGKHPDRPIQNGMFMHTRLNCSGIEPDVVSSQLLNHCVKAFYFVLILDAERIQMRSMHTDIQCGVEIKATCESS